jgi:hypothetical protein
MNQDGVSLIHHSAFRIPHFFFSCPSLLILSPSSVNGGRRGWDVRAAI